MNSHFIQCRQNVILKMKLRCDCENIRLLRPARPFFYVTVGLIKLPRCVFHRRLISQASRILTALNCAFLALLVAYILVASFWPGFQWNPTMAALSYLVSGQITHAAKCPWGGPIVLAAYLDSTCS